MITLKQKDIFFQTLWQLYPENRTDLIRSTPRQLLVAVVMSAQTTDKQVNKVTEKFFDTIKTPYDTLKLTEAQRYEYVKWVNYAPTKAKNLYKTAVILTAQWAVIARNAPWKKYPWGEAIQSKSPTRKITNSQKYTIPSTLSELIKLHWVGEKTAKVILHVLYGTNDIAVDTHVHRVSNRIWLVKTKTPLQTSKLLDKAIPDKYKHIAHHTLIFFWRYHCTARKPKCQECPFTKFCNYYKNEK